MNTAPRTQAYDSLAKLFMEFEAEETAVLRARERGTFDRLAHPWERSIVLIGAGFLGNIVLEGLRKAGIEPLAFTDNDPKRWGTEFKGVQVLSPEQATKQYGNKACFVPSIYNSSAVRKQFQYLGCQRVVHTAPLFWKYPELFIPQNGIDLPHRIREQRSEIEAGYSTLADEASRKYFLEQLRSRYWLDFDHGLPPLDPRDVYFPADLVHPKREEVFVDCGAFNGDTVRSFLTHRGNQFKQIVSFEPDPENRKELSAFVSAHPELQNGRISVQPYAVANENCQTTFNVTNSAGSSLAAGSGFEVECRRLDDIEWQHVPTYIKMDIEGAEADALLGAAKLLRHSLPVLAICLYHRSQHLWQVPNLIRSIAPEYSLFIRHYAEECWESVCYAVPAERLVEQRS